MQRLIWTVLISFLAAIALGPVFIPWLKRMKFGQNVYELATKRNRASRRWAASSFSSRWSSCR
jgi:UDP-N-acetylmuramyl pentapeptide phosphotransferase/UDP-N-acetylglucosamine-1-phosphate transferase